MPNANQNILDELRARLADPPPNADVLRDWLGLAARMAAAGGERIYVDENAARFIAAFGLNENLERWVLARAQEGAYDLENATGEFLGFAVVDTQDWNFLTRLDPRPSWMSENIQALLRGWGACTKDVVLDSEAQTVVDAYRDRYQFASNLLLPLVAAPFSSSEILFLRQLAEHLRRVQEQPAKAADSLPLRVAASESTPPILLQWVSPEGALYARVALLPKENRATVQICHLDGTDAKLLHGIKGSLGNAVFVLDHGSASLSPNDPTYILRLQLNPTLLIAGTIWMALPRV